MSLETSGSTSESKTIRLAKSDMRTSALKTQAYFGYHSGDSALLCLPVKYIGGMMMLVRAIVSELRLIIVAPTLDPLSSIDEQVDFLPMTSAQMLNSLTNSLPQINQVKNILLGGGPVSRSLLNQLQDIEAACFHSFGMTETISHVAIRQLNHDGQSDIFHAIEGVQFSVDEDNCIIISGDHLREDIYTNDVVELMDEVSFIWKGRKDNVINSGGIKLYPELIEPKLSEIIAYPYFISSIEDARFGRVVSLFIECDSKSDFTKLYDSLSLHLSQYEMPKKIYKVSKFVMTATGKIQRQKSVDLALTENNII